MFPLKRVKRIIERLLSKVTEEELFLLLPYRCDADDYFLLLAVT
ncbi:hypothetical protein BLGI_1885 [Brevibacillus laterosporus GI-9]|nr:hypothetical protein BLGI_1885 [Brevibacillus laterosporus GI-9]